MKIIVSKQAENSREWDTLCKNCNNINQSTFMDSVYELFNSEALYFQCFLDQKLIGGIKAYTYKSKKLPVCKGISSSFTILGECINDPSYPDVITELNKAIVSYILSNRIVRVRSSGYYGGTDLLPLYSNNLNGFVHHFNVSAFDLTRSQEELWKHTKESHRRNINKAIKSGVELVEDNDIERFLLLLNETYAHQSKQAPNQAFIKKLFAALFEKGYVKIYFAKHNGQYLASSFVIEFGRFAEYAFGGNLKNNVGAGHYLHWNIALLYQQKQYLRYILGQVAAEGTSYQDNKKFEQGITRFKKDFATFELPSASIEIITSPVKYKAWKLIGRLAGL